MHVFGTGATGMVHIGQAVMGCSGTIDYLVNAVFNYPTLAESYKVAALDETNDARDHPHVQRRPVRAVHAARFMTSAPC